MRVRVAPDERPCAFGDDGARADGAFAFVGAPMPVKAALPRNRKRGHCRMAAAGISLMLRRHDLRRACASVLSVARRRRGRGAEARRAPDGAPARLEEFPSPPPRLWRLLHKDGRQGPRGNDCASWENSDGSAESARAP